jgi:hypothetical protein
MSSRAASIKFTMEMTCPRNYQLRGQREHECKDFMKFLELKMFVDREGFIQTFRYRKPNMKCQYLRPDSAHRATTSPSPLFIGLYASAVCLE